MKNGWAKRSLALFLMIAVFVSACPKVNADTQVKHALSFGIKAFWEANEDVELTEHTGAGHLSYVKDLRNSITGSLAMEVLGLIYNTGSEPDEAKYMEVLINIMKTYEMENAPSMSEQNKLDNLKTFGDLGLDALGIAVDLLPGAKGLSKAVQDKWEGLKIAIGGLEKMAGNTDNWIDELSDLETILQNYARHDSFLALIETRSDGALRNAASSLRKSMSEAINIKLKTYANITEDNLKEYTEFFFEDVFFVVLKQTNTYEKDDIFKKFVNIGSKACSIWTTINLGTEIAKLVCNIAVGSQDVINRVLEMKAIYDISWILEEELERIKWQYPEKNSDESDKEAECYIAYSNYLISGRIRGEYCLYSMLARDSKLFAHFGEETAQLAELQYNRLTQKLRGVKENLDNIDDILIVEVENWFPYESVGPNSEWHLYDKNGQLYDNYTLRVYYEQTILDVALNREIDPDNVTFSEYIVSSAEPPVISLEPGCTYAFEFIDNSNPENVKKLTVYVVSDDQLLTDIVEVRTSFGVTPCKTKQPVSVNVTEAGKVIRKIALTYNENGRVQEVTDQYLDEDGEPYSISVERYVYNTQGNLIQQESEYPEFTYVDEFVYDNAGNLVSSTIQEPGGWSQNAYEYNSNGQLVRITEESQIYTRVTEYTYNSDGVRIGEVITYDESGLVWIVECTYEYDSQQRLSKIVKVSPEGTETDFYEYDDQGREIKLTTETPWNTTYRTLDYDYSPFVIQQYEGGETYLMLDDWSLWLGDVKLNTDADGYLISAEIPELDRLYQFCYEGGSTQESTTRGEVLVSDAYSDYGVRDNGQVNNYHIPKLNISGDAAEKTNAAIYKDLYDGVYKKIKNRNGGSSGITYSWTESNGVISILTMWEPEDYTGHGPIYFETYNASSDNGALLSLEQVTQAYNMTVDEFYTLAKERIEMQYIELNGQFESMEWAKEYYNQCLNTIRSDEYIRGLKPFISESGDLCVVAKMYYVGVMESHEDLFNVTGTATPDAPAFSRDMPEEANTEEWKDLYAAYIEENRSYFFNIYDSYTIAYVDDDEIPEILLTSSSAMPGSAILWITNGVVNEKSEIGYGSIHYYEKQGLVCTSWMNHGNYADTIYTLSNGAFTKLHMGRIYEDGSYEWDDQSVTREQYDTSLREIFDRAIALEVNYDASVDTLIAEIMNWN